MAAMALSPLHLRMPVAASRPTLSLQSTKCSMICCYPKSLAYSSPTTTSMRNVRACSTAKNGATLENPSRFDPVLDPLRAFPWDRAFIRFGARVLDLIWSAGKWLFVPVLLVSALGEVSYTLVKRKTILIPIGMLAGVLLCGLIKETFVEISPVLQITFPWHIIFMGLFFGLLKLPGPRYPGWARLVLPHFANGGLWQTWVFLRKWQSAQSIWEEKQEEEEEEEEEEVEAKTR